MLKRFKITSCAFILCLFGVTLTTVSPVLAEDSTEFQECQRIKPNGTNRLWLMEKKDCFRDLARRLSAANFAQEPLIEKSTDTASQLLAPNADQEDLSVKISELEGKLAYVEAAHAALVVGINKEHNQLTEANTKITDLEGKLAYVEAAHADLAVVEIRVRKHLTIAYTRITDLEGKLAYVEAAFKDATSEVKALKSKGNVIYPGKFANPGDHSKNKISDYTSCEKLSHNLDHTLELYRYDVVDERSNFIRLCE